jgi:hypothetical protein
MTATASQFRYCKTAATALKVLHSKNNPINNSGTKVSLSIVQVPELNNNSYSINSSGTLRQQQPHQLFRYCTPTV